MSESVDLVIQAVLLNRTPREIQKMSFQNSLSFSSWVRNLQERVKFIRGWLEDGVPKLFWLPGLFSANGFQLGLLQMSSRNQGYPLEKLVLDYQLIPYHRYKELGVGKQHPAQGIFIYGFYLDGAQWDFHFNVLRDPLPGQLISPLPVIHAVPKKEFWVKVIGQLLPRVWENKFNFLIFFKSQLK